MISPMGNPDAEAWVDDFIAHVKADPLIPTDRGTMLAWFASAIMTGFDEGRRKK